MTPNRWKEHAYPLQQLTILCQGTRHTDRDDLLDQIQIALGRLRQGEDQGSEHDADFGYRFEMLAEKDGPSFFVEPVGRT